MAKKIKVLHFPFGTTKGGKTKGGMTKYAIDNWNMIDKTIFQFDFATMNHFLTFEDDILKTGARVLHIDHYAENEPEKFYIDMYKILVEGNYDIVHLHTSRWKSTLAEKIAKEVGIRKVIIHAHSTGVVGRDEAEKEKNLTHHNKVVESLTPDIATDYWACSSAAAGFLFGKNIPKSMIRIMPNAIDIDRYVYNSPLRKIIRKEMNLENNFVIGHVGRIACPKNQEFLLRVVQKLTEAIPSIKLILVGDGSNRESCEKYVSDNGLQEYVVFTGYRADTERLLQAFDAFVMPSYFEGVSLALIEAQAAGLPCLASDRMPKDVNITDSVNFLPLDVNTWCKAIKECYSEQVWPRYDNLCKIRDAGYDIRRQIKEVEKAYMEGF